MNCSRSFLLVMILSAGMMSVSCMHKSVREDRADDVEEAFILDQGGHKYLVVYELVFQAISKSSGRGITTIQGYNDSRVSCYDLATGALVARQPMGRYGEGKATILIGLTPGNLWFYSVQPDKGLFSLDPLTLLPKTSQDQIFTGNPGLKGHLAAPKWYETAKYFLTDPAGEKVQITDDQGFRYLLDPAGLKAEKAPDSLFRPDFHPDPYLTGSIQLDKDTSLQLRGEIRQQFEVNYREVDDTLSFLAGMFIIRQDPSELRILDPHKESPLRPDSSDFFVAHRSNTDKDAGLVISRVHYECPAGFSVVWTTIPEGIFYNAGDAKETDAFKRVFSKGDPEFDFQYFTLEDDLLVGIYMLRAFAIDINTGKVKWIREI